MDKNKKYKETWLYGKKVIITGAGSGFGKLLCEKLVMRYNCEVLGIGRTESKLLTLKNELSAQGYNNFSYKTFDAGNEENWINLKNEFLLSGRHIDVLINNAGVLPPFCKYEKLKNGELEKAFSANFFASAYSIKHLIYIIKSRGSEETDLSAKSETDNQAALTAKSIADGDIANIHAKSENDNDKTAEFSKNKPKRPDRAIINVSSSAALACVIGTSAYTASKSALAAFTKVISLENDDLYISLVMPGFSKTSIFRNQAEVDEKEKNLIAKVCGDPDKMTDNMIKGFIKQKKRIITGADAHAMSVFGRLFPSFTDKAIKNVLKKANLATFYDVFGD